MSVAVWQTTDKTVGGLSIRCVTSLWSTTLSEVLRLASRDDGVKLFLVLSSTWKNVLREREKWANTDRKGRTVVRYETV